TLNATESAFGGAASSSNNTVLGLTGLSVDDSVNLTVGQTKTVDVAVDGTFVSQDSVTLVPDSDNVTIGSPSVVHWDNNTGGIISFPVTGISAGDVTFTATESAFNGTATSTGAVNLPILAVTTSDARENGWDGKFHFALTNADGSVFVAPAAMPISYVLVGSVDSNGNDDTAAPGANYSDLGPVVIPQGASSLDVPVHALDDHNIDPTLYVTLGITSNQVSVSSTSELQSLAYL